MTESKTEIDKHNVEDKRQYLAFLQGAIERMARKFSVLEAVDHSCVGIVLWRSHDLEERIAWSGRHCGHLYILDAGCLLSDAGKKLQEDL